MDVVDIILMDLRNLYAIVAVVLVTEYVTYARATDNVIEYFNGYLKKSVLLKRYTDTHRLTKDVTF